MYFPPCGGHRPVGDRGILIYKYLFKCYNKILKLKMRIKNRSWDIRGKGKLIWSSMDPHILLNIF